MKWLKKGAIALAVWMAVGAVTAGSVAVAASDSYIRDRVVKLYSKNGSCSGIQIRTPHNTIIILTAAHCKAVAVDGVMTARLEDGKEIETHILAIDTQKDLMAMSPASKDFITIAGSVSKHEHVHTLTHGAGMPTYRTDGELLEERDLEIMVGDMLSPCNEPGQHMEMSMFGPVCVAKMHSMMSTARVVPGSSGGPVLDQWGHLVGIVSNSDGEMFSGFVTLHDIKEFLADK